MEAWEVNMRHQQGEIKTTGNHIASSINDMYIFILNNSIVYRFDFLSQFTGEIGRK